MSFDLDRIYDLLPAHHRVLDARRGGPLKALLSVVAEQVAATESDLDRLYDDLFIETCADWVVPYLGELVGVRGLVSIPGARFDPRATVANTIAYRRRKGTAAVLEQVARDVTGWDASVVEYFERLVTTQYTNHLRPHSVAVTSVRHRPFTGLGGEDPAARQDPRTQDQWATVERLGSPFDLAPRTVEVRRVGSRRGRYNIPSVGIHLWRLASQPMEDVRPYRVAPRRYTFDPLGREVGLFNRVRAEEQITHLADPENVPHPLTRAELARELERHWGPDGSLAIVADGSDVSATPIAAPASVAEAGVVVCFLGDLTDAGGSVTGWANLPEDRVAVDPVLGRIAFPTSLPAPADVRVSFHRGFSAEVGGGQYGRSTGFPTAADLLLIPVTGTGPLQPALDAARDGVADPEDPAVAVVEIGDSETRVETPAVEVPERPGGVTVQLRAADEAAPLLVAAGDVEVTGGRNGVASLDGLVIRGTVVVPRLDRAGRPNALARLRIRHCTLSPDPGPGYDGAPAEPAFTPRLVVEAPGVVVEVEASVLGAIRAVEGAEVRIRNSVVDAGSPGAMAYAAPDGFGHGAPLEAENLTVVGRVRARLLRRVSNTIFFATAAGPMDPPVEARQLQEGCVRYSYLPPGSRVPRPHRCQPGAPADAARVTPVFTTLRFGAAAYGQLAAVCPVEIREGADDSAEMGAFHDLYQPQREAALRTRLEEHLRFGLEAGVFHGT